MKKIIALISIAGSCAMATEGTLGEYGISEFKGDNFLGINETTTYYLENFSWEEALGITGESRTTIETSYEFNSLRAGKKIANHAANFAIQDRRGLFGGESYTKLSYLYAADNAYANDIAILSGWKHNIFEFAHLDIGGDFEFTDKDVYADYRPAKLGEGTSTCGNIYFGFIGDVPEIQPFVYYVYDFSFASHEFRTGINPNYDFEGPLEDFHAEASLYVGYVYSSDFCSSDHIDATESYWYTIAKASLIYDICKHFYAKATVGYGYNTTNGVGGIAGYDCGPRKNIFASFTLGFGF